MTVGEAGHQVGSLVTARGRDWVVLPSDDAEVLLLRPLSGSEDEACGLYLPLEADHVEAAHFLPPRPEQAGDFIAGSLLRDAARLSLRSSAAPLRSFARISVRPRPYQLVPLIMALRLDPVRMLIADDVGVGKTIEAALIARELLDRGEIRRVCVVCPPHLCDQWRRELAAKFQIRAVVVRTNTLARLERDLPRRDISVYQHYQHLVVSVDFVKSRRHRALFLSHCPEFVIVDEAHAAAQPGGALSGSQQQRHELVHAVAEDANRHLLLLTATPHSGLEDSFRSLLGLLAPEFETWTTAGLSQPQRRRLAQHFVQRLRADLERWLGTETTFPTRKPEDVPYDLSEEYDDLFRDILDFTRETIVQPGLPEPRQRVRYWAALSLLRCVMSSPAAAAAALRKRAGDLSAGAPQEEEVDDEVRQWQILDPLREEGTNDTVPESAVEAGERDLSSSERRKLREFARRAEALREREHDPKIRKAAEITIKLLRKRYRPIIYCRFIETAKYVAEELAARLKSDFPSIRTLAVTSETGSDEEREVRVEELAEASRRVLVATDCLSEGVNLQDHYDAVIHYDLPWNPNRLEQREGRVDRFGQQTTEVPAILLYGRDNEIDVKVLEVLIRKARAIFKATGVRAPVPVESETVVSILTKALFGRGRDTRGQLRLDMSEADREQVEALLSQWDRAAELDRESRTRFAQHAIRPDEVAAELEATDEVVGDPGAVRAFFLNAAQRLSWSVQQRNGHYVIDPASLSETLRSHLGWKKPTRVVFEAPPPRAAEDAEVLDRNHPLIATLSERILSDAFSPRAAETQRRFSRCGAAYSTEVEGRTALLLLRLRYRLESRGAQPLYAEEVVLSGLRGAGSEVEWLRSNGDGLLKLLQATPSANIAQQERDAQVEWALRAIDGGPAELRQLAQERAGELEHSYDRVRQQLARRKTRVIPYDPDVLGVYVLVPGGRR